MLLAITNEEQTNIAIVIGNHKFIKGDICNRELVEFIFNEYDIQGVIHFAAESANFSKQNIMSQIGSFTQAQANAA